jgi:hypothetical protein
VPSKAGELELERKLVGTVRTGKDIGKERKIENATG